MDSSSLYFIINRTLKPTGVQVSRTNKMEEPELVLAKILYDKYCAGVGGKAFNGDPLPPSAEFFADPNKIKQSEAWVATAKEAINWVNSIEW